MNIKYLLLILLLMFACDRNVKNENEVKVVKTKVKDLTQEQVEIMARSNSCYLPLTRNNQYFSKYVSKRLVFDDLFNLTLDSTHPYRNRYIVGDLNVLDDSGNVRGLIEMNPRLDLLKDFSLVDSSLLLKLQNSHQVRDFDIQGLLESSRRLKTKQKKDLMDFYTSVWKYYTPGLNRKFAFSAGSVFAAGQKLCLCEAYEDTLIEVARFGTSGKRMDPIITHDSSGRERIRHIEYIPIGDKRDYYGFHYIISSKNWETQRAYKGYAQEHDSVLGGGNDRVTIFRDKVELPNFLLMKPMPCNNKAMRQNGIHEVALRELSRGMLGSANSIGCIRVTDFASKFLRWWTPQDANFFILYTDSQYNKVYSKNNSLVVFPFKNKPEGDAFRVWLNQSHPIQAQQMEISTSGSFDNGFILDAYNIYGKEYESYKLALAKKNSKSNR